MKAFIAVLAFVAAVSAEAPAYGVPAGPAFGSFGGGSFGASSAGSFGGSAAGQTYRHVYVHSAPDLPEDSQSRVIRIPGGADKHVNIIFVKTPSGSHNQQTEVILPEQDQQKTIVYVLHKKFNAATDLKIRRPASSAPARPEVYFIRYANGGQGGGYQGGAAASSAGASTGSSSGVSTGYGF